MPRLICRGAAYLNQPLEWTLLKSRPSALCSLYYELDEESKRWNISGSIAGLLKLCKILEDYVLDPRNEKISEHDHLGPYMYLTITTWKKRELDGSGIVGTLPDIKYMSDLVRGKLSDRIPGDKIEIGTEYDEKTEYRITFQIMDDEFDPSALDPMEWANNIKE